MSSKHPISSIWAIVGLGILDGMKKETRMNNEVLQILTQIEVLADPFMGHGEREEVTEGFRVGGFVNSYRRKPSGLSSLGTKENSGQASELIHHVVVPSESNAVSIKEHRGPAVLGNHSGTVLPLSSSGADGSSIRQGNSDETCNNDNLVLLSDSHMEEGKLKDDAVVYEFDGELDGFAEFAGDFEFGIGDEYNDDLGEEDTPFSEISETVKSAVVGEEVAIAVVPSVGGSVKDPLIGGNYSSDEMIISKDKEVVKDGKYKDGKVALPKLTGCP